MDDLFAKGVEKVVLPGTGHFLHLERPEEVARRIVAFLKQP
jgi:pimeloyl-ACP methyl ester carboxylesterase